MSWPVIILVMLAFFALNMRLYLAILVSVLVYFVFFQTIPHEIAIQRFISSTQNTSLLAIPFFILLGSLLAYSGIAERVVALAQLLVGRIRGGLALTNIMVSTLMGGLSASNLADSAMLARMMVPEMEKNGYNKAFSSAVTAAGSLITPIIPPGIALIIYSLMAEVSVGRMFMAGVVPGLVCAAFMLVTAYLVSVKRGYKPSHTRRPTTNETVRTVIGAWPAIFLVGIVIGGVRLGIFTPTEAGAAAVGIVIVIGMFIYRTMNLKHVISALVETGKSTASVMLVIMASSALAWVFSMEQAGPAFAEYITSLTDNKLVFILSLNLCLLFFGMLIEGTAILIVLVPLLMPTIKAFGIDPYHFGIIMVLNLSIGTLTPPVGTVMLVVSNITKTSVADFTREALPFYGALLAVLALIIMVPAISIGLVY
ncbi:TRAP transporter large permease [Rhodobacteraceae bacterium RKSG542]|uniref:TRAP transporter large permease n=1 Tax=Pseudovibrio flavus TaxID=2529854 RepID=UPI0012BCE202|nr:TRAP transporter large permease [Pseudovibrio flavus]MTI17935.1 TRAP transporter large permease [Pseudovibrio flavus]